MKHLLTISLLALSLCCFAQAPTSLVHNTSTHVDDFAGKFSPAEEQELNQVIQAFWDTAQIELVTVNSLEGMDISDYAIELGNHWGVGHKSNNGVLIVWAPNERKYFTATGGGVQGDLTDAFTGDMQREVLVPHLKASTYAEGFRELLLAYIGRMSPSGKEMHQAQVLADGEHDHGDTAVIVFCIILALGTCGFLFYIFYLEPRKERKREAAAAAANAASDLRKEALLSSAHTAYGIDRYSSGPSGSRSSTGRRKSSSGSSSSSSSSSSGSSYSSYDSGSSSGYDSGSSWSSGSDSGSSFGGGSFDGGGSGGGY